MRLRVFHAIQYHYSAPARESQYELRLMPLSDDDQTCLDFRLGTVPPTRLFAYDLPTGRVHHFSLRAAHTRLTITAESSVVTRSRDPFASLPLASNDAAFYNRAEVRERFQEYLTPTSVVTLHPETDRIAAVARRRASGGTTSFLIALMRLLHRAFVHSLETESERAPDISRDFLHLMLAVCRRQGIPARYVSGYLFTEADESLMAEGAGPNEALRGWVECLLPDNTWHGFDPLRNLLVDERYVKVHYGRDYSDALPLKGGYYGSGEQTKETYVRVTADPA